VDRKIAIRHFFVGRRLCLDAAQHFLCKFAIGNRQFKIKNSFGGIAQLVERQLCKLEVRGSNPLASKA
jgi:hypothetical protein